MKNGANPTPSGRAARVSMFLGLRRSTVGVLTMAILVGMGEHMAERFLPIYMMALGGGAMSIGLLNGMDNLLSALYAFPGGYLSDRVGVKRSLLIFNLISMAGFVIVVAVPSWKAVLVGAVLFISWSAISLPATMSLIHKALPADKRTMGVSMHSLVRRVPMALGPILGGLCIGIWGERDGVRAAFVIALILSALAVALQQKLISVDPLVKGGAVSLPERNPLRLIGRMSPALRGLLVTDILVRFCEQIPYAFVVIWCMKVIESPVSALQFGLLTCVEMATAVLVYIPVAYLADRSAKKPFVAITFLFFTLFPLVLMYCRSFNLLVAAFVLRGLKEFGEPTRKAMIVSLAPDDCKAGMFGLYYLIRDTFVSVAAMGGAILWLISPETNLLSAFAFGVIGTAGYIIFAREPRAAN